MIDVKKFGLPELNNEALKAGFIVSFGSMTAAAVLNSVSWMTLGAAGAPGKAGFMLAFGVSALAGIFAGLLSRKHLLRLERVEEHARSIAKGDVANSYVTAADIADPLHQHLNLIAEAQLKRVEEFHRLLEDSRIREERLYEALDLMDDEIAVYDPSSMLVTVNKAFTKHCNFVGAPVGPGMLRREVLKAVAHAPHSGVPKNEIDMWLEHQLHMREMAVNGRSPVDTLQRDGRHLRFTVIETPSKNQIEITTDISEAVNNHLESERHKREADATEKIKDVTVARLINTIRTPMNGVLAAAELLNETDLCPEQQNKLDIIRRSAGTLLGIVQDNMPETLQQAEPAAPLAIPETMPLPRPRRALLLIRAEALLTRMTEMLQKDGIQTVALETIELALEVLSETDGEFVKFDFVMTDDHAAFAEFSQWSANVLQVNRPQIIDLNHVMNAGFSPNRDDAAAEPQVTTQDLPLEKPAAAPRSAAHFLPQREMTAAVEAKPRAELVDKSVKKQRRLPIEILVIEHNDVNQIVYDQVLGNCGQQYLIVSSGEEGISTALRERPKLVLMDISMPGTNGLEAARRLRTELTGDKRPVIVGMTSHFLTGDREKCLASGLDDYALKPTLPGALRKQIAGWMGYSEHGGSAGKAVG